MRFYTAEDGTNVPSVTTILSNISSESLMAWSNYLGFKHIKYTDELYRSANQGTLIHEWLRNIIHPGNPGDFYKDIPCLYTRDLKERVEFRFKQLIDQYTYETIDTEIPLVSSNLGYGGTMDWYTVLSGYTVLIDFKTSKAVREKHLLQLGGYYNLMKEKGMKVEGAGIIIANANKASLFMITLKTLEYLGEGFTHLANYYNTMNQYNMLAENSEFPLMLPPQS